MLCEGSGVCFDRGTPVDVTHMDDASLVLSVKKEIVLQTHMFTHTKRQLCEVPLL